MRASTVYAHHIYSEVFYKFRSKYDGPIFIFKKDERDIDYQAHRFWCFDKTTAAPISLF